jgi:hypothetical protein
MIHIIKPENRGRIAYCGSPIDPHHETSLMPRKAAGLTYEECQEQNVCDDCQKELSRRLGETWLNWNK